MPLFCRHNRMTANCPICSREQEAERRASSPPRTRQAAAGGRARTGAARRGAGAARRQRAGHPPDGAARLQDDGYRNPLVPGLRARPTPSGWAPRSPRRPPVCSRPGPTRTSPPSPTASRPPGWPSCSPSPARTIPSCSRRSRGERPAWASGELPALPEALQPHGRRPTARGPQRAGSQVAALRGRARRGIPSGASPSALERLALPGFPRDPRFELLVTLGAAGVYPIAAAGALHVGREDDATTLAAKRLLVSGDPRLLERRAADLAARGRAADRRARSRPRRSGATPAPGRSRQAGASRGRSAAPRRCDEPDSDRSGVFAVAARLGDAGDPQSRRDQAAARAAPAVAAAAGRLRRRAGGVSLLAPSEPTYDPWAWIIWGREITELRAQHGRRAVLEAAAGALHDAVRAVRRRRSRPTCG